MSRSWYIFRETLNRLLIVSKPTVDSTISAELQAGWKSATVVAILALEGNPSLSLYSANAFVRRKQENP